LLVRHYFFAVSFITRASVNAFFIIFNFNIMMQRALCFAVDGCEARDKEICCVDLALRNHFIQAHTLVIKAVLRDGASHTENVNILFSFPAQMRRSSYYIAH
jgi:hypothetical protein